MCPPPQGEKKAFLYHHKQPDTALAIFNSPFGPDVLIATDALSEGIDLHSYCRTVIHYELNPSPIRTIQREGRLRRINSWAAKTQKPVERSYPCFKGTRDERLVKIMKDRLDAFSLLLGGAPEIQLEDDAETRERWRMEVINAVKSKLQKNSAALRAHPPR
jgi:superfamily II DNA/RNA helicase